MDLMYSRYADPMGLMRLYINQGRFGELVENVLHMEQERKRQNAEQQEDWKLWFAYLTGMHEESFEEWKKSLKKTMAGNTRTGDMELSESGIKKILDDCFN